MEVVAGALISSAFVILSYILISYFNEFGHFAKEWQNLIASMTALFSAILTVFFLHRQIKQIDMHRKDNLRRKKLATNATLLFVLYQLIDYYTRCGRSLRDIWITQRADETAFENQGSVDARCLSGLPPFPSTIARELKEAIEFSAPCGEIALTELVQKLQIFKARIEVWDYENETLITDIPDLFVLLAEIFLRTDRLFSYAREEAEPMNDLTPENISKVIRMRFGLDEQDIKNTSGFRRKIEKFSEE